MKCLLSLIHAPHLTYIYSLLCLVIILYDITLNFRKYSKLKLTTVVACILMANVESAGVWGSAWTIVRMLPPITSWVIAVNVMAVLERARAKGEMALTCFTQGTGNSFCGVLMFVRGFRCRWEGAELG
jgi:hypothetical protein